MKLIKKMLACVCALSVMACLFVGVSFTASAAYSGEGEGTELKPYLVKTAAQLGEVVKMGTASEGKFFKMTNNIAINPGTVNASGLGFANWGYSGESGLSAFKGNFDGDGYVVSGLYYDNGTAHWKKSVGLFPLIADGAVIKNLGLTNSYLASSKNDMVMGSIVGYLQDQSEATIENCYVDSTVTVNSSNGAGIVGFVDTSLLNMTNCYFTAQTNSTGSAVARLFNATYSKLVINGFYTDKATLFGPDSENTISAAESSAVYYVGTAVAGYTEKGATAIATADLIKGDAAKTNMAALDWTNAFKAKNNDYPILRAFIRSTITFDQSAVGGAEVIDPIVVPASESKIPAAPAGFHWMNGTIYVKDKITTDVDVTLVATACAGGTATCKELAKCATCGAEYGQLSTEHDTELKNVKAATCKEEGYSGDKVCKICEQTIEPGSKTKVSDVHSDTTVIDAKEATCEAEGYTGDEVCFTCDTVVKKGEAIAKKAHTMVDGKCTVCGVSETVASAPQTGEGSTAILWLTILGLNAVAAVLLFACKKRMGAAE